jgi:hypothetical protein
MGTVSWTEDDVKKLFCNPIYVGMGPYSQLIPKDQWIQNAVKTINEVGVEEFLSTMIDNLREAFEPGATPYGYKRREKKG